MGRVVKFNDEPELDAWEGDECNRIIGTDSTIFPPFMKKEDGLWAFEADVCRSMRAHYVKKSRYAGMPTSFYSLDLGDLKVRKLNSNGWDLDLKKIEKAYFKSFFEL